MPAFQDDRAVPTIAGATHPAADIVVADDARRGARHAAVSDDGARRPPGGVAAGSRARGAVPNMNYTQETYITSCFSFCTATQEDETK